MVRVFSDSVLSDVERCLKWDRRTSKTDDREENHKEINMKKVTLFLLLVLFPALIFPAFAEGVLWTGNEWDGDIEAGHHEIVSIGRESARVDSIPYADLPSAETGAAEYRKELSPYYLLLSQQEWDFSYYENPAAAEAEKDFYRTVRMNGLFCQTTSFIALEQDRELSPSHCVHKHLLLMGKERVYHSADCTVFVGRSLEGYHIKSNGPMQKPFCSSVVFVQGCECSKN